MTHDAQNSPVFRYVYVSNYDTYPHRVRQPVANPEVENPAGVIGASTDEKQMLLPRCVMNSPLSTAKASSSGTT